MVAAQASATSFKEAGIQLFKTDKQVALNSNNDYYYPFLAEIFNHIHVNVR